MSCTVCHKVDTGEWNLEVGGMLQHAGVCNYVSQLQHDHIQHQNMTFPKHR